MCCWNRIKGLYVRYWGMSGNVKGQSRLLHHTSNSCSKRILHFRWFISRISFSHFSPRCKSLAHSYELNKRLFLINVTNKIQDLVSFKILISSFLIWSFHLNFETLEIIYRFLLLNEVSLLSASRFPSFRFLPSLSFFSIIKTFKKSSGVWTKKKKKVTRKRLNGYFRKKGKFSPPGTWDSAEKVSIFFNTLSPLHSGIKHFLILMEGKGIGY